MLFHGVTRSISFCWITFNIELLTMAIVYRWPNTKAAANQMLAESPK